MAGAQALLEVHDVAKSFGAVAAVQGVSFPLYAGEAHANAARLFTRLGVHLDPARPARGLSIADQQIVEIAKAVSSEARVLIMDEPTAALSGVEVERREHVKDGTVKNFALWNPAGIGYLAAYAGAALSSGQITGKEGAEFTAGKLGEYTIAKDGEIVLGPPTECTAQNIDQFDF